MPVLLTPLTPPLARRLQQEADLALNGKGCDLEAMKSSCFASESCGKSKMALKELLSHDLAIVAVDTERTPSFAGCVSCLFGKRDPVIRRFFPHVPVSADSLIIFNLCVSKDFRNQKVASQLMSAVSLHCSPGHHCFLLVSKGNPHLHHVQGAREEFTRRVDNLKSMYEHWKFRHVCDNEDVILMRR